MIKYTFLICLIFTSCTFETPTEFSKKALEEKLLKTNNQAISFEEIISNHKGKKIFINVWASWCADCIKGLASVKKLQSENSEVVFLFLSVDENNAGWKRGIERFKIIGEHYNLPKGMKKGDLVDFLNVRWIPRYMVVDEKGSITLFKATKITDEKIITSLKKSL